MRTTIDKAGRLVIPRSIRDRIGLAGGGEVELELDGAAVRIEPVVGRELREDGGLLFIPDNPCRIVGVRAVTGEVVANIQLDGVGISSPTVADGRLFIGASERLHAFAPGGAI